MYYVDVRERNLKFLTCSKILIVATIVLALPLFSHGGGALLGWQSTVSAVIVHNLLASLPPPTPDSSGYIAGYMTLYIRVNSLSLRPSSKETHCLYGNWLGTDHDTVNLRLTACRVTWSHGVDIGEGGWVFGWEGAGGGGCRVSACRRGSHWFI